VSDPSISVRYAVNVRPKEGILDPQGRAVEGSLRHLSIEGVSDVRVGRRVELTVSAVSGAAARGVVERLAEELLSNPLIEAYDVEEIGGASSISGASSLAGSAAAAVGAR
jgi:phosphoribosylformylglycinamidine synthase PurS subunit